MVQGGEEKMFTKALVQAIVKLPDSILGRNQIRFIAKKIFFNPYFLDFAIRICIFKLVWFIKRGYGMLTLVLMWGAGGWSYPAF